MNDHISVSKCIVPSVWVKILVFSGGVYVLNVKNDMTPLRSGPLFIGSRKRIRWLTVLQELITFSFLNKTWLMIYEKNQRKILNLKIQKLLSYCKVTNKNISE